MNLLILIFVQCAIFYRIFLYHLQDVLSYRAVGIPVQRVFTVNHKVRHLCFYSVFQITFHCMIPNFVAKFENLLRSSQVHFRFH